MRFGPIHTLRLAKPRKISIRHPTIYSGYILDIMA